MTVCLLGERFLGHGAIYTLYCLNSEFNLKILWHEFHSKGSCLKMLDLRDSLQCPEESVLFMEEQKVSRNNIYALFRFI